MSIFISASISLYLSVFYSCYLSIPFFNIYRFYLPITRTPTYTLFQITLYREYCCWHLLHSDMFRTFTCLLHQNYSSAGFPCIIFQGINIHCYFLFFLHNLQTICHLILPNIYRLIFYDFCSHGANGSYQFYYCHYLLKLLQRIFLPDCVVFI